MPAKGPADEPKELTTAEVADLLDVDPSTVWRWIRKGRLAAEQVGNAYRVKESDAKTMRRRFTATAATSTGSQG